MQSQAQTVTSSKPMLWTGRILSALAILFLTFDSVIKVLTLPPAVESTTQLGYASSLLLGLGLLELLCLVLYIIPRTAVLGAIVMTGYLGGAIATHIRAGSPLFSVVFPVIIGLLLWGGLFFRNHQLRALIPLQR